jgi:excisionase family DNA binding protein
MTIRELNQYAKNNNLSKIYQSYTTIYGLIRSGKVPAMMLGNRYLLRISDVEKYLSGQIACISGGIRRID